MIEKYIQGYYIPNISRLAKVVLKELGVSAEVDIQPLKIKTSDAISYVERYGSKYDANKKAKYTIFIDTAILKADELSDPMINLMIHEIWHVKQMEDGRLRANTGSTVAVWEGVHYTMTMPHEQRPWEIEAKNKETEYLSQIKESHFEAI